MSELAASRLQCVRSTGGDTRGRDTPVAGISIWPSSLAIRHRFGIKQAVEVHDEVPHPRVVYRRVRPRLPGVPRRAVVRIDADDVELRKIGESSRIRIDELAAENQMEKLLLRVHRLSPVRKWASVRHG